MSGIRFSEHFGLGSSQWELDFVDIPLESDIRLFVDPYAISILRDNFSKECNKKIVIYFDLLLQAIKGNDKKTVKDLLGNLHEPYDTHLGFSTGRHGKGIGSEKAKFLLKAFSESKAAKTGFLDDLSDCSLLIPGIGRDNISDMTINIIRSSLVTYTESQCDLYGIPTRKIAAGKCFDFESLTWQSKYAKLPIYEDSRLLLVPKTMVRHVPTISPVKYYRRFVLDYLEAEHARPGDSLAHVLKNGRIKVSREKLKEKYPYSQDFLYDFSKKHPEILDKYKADLRHSFHEITNGEIESLQTDQLSPSITQLKMDLSEIVSGKNSASQYHNYVLRVLPLIFGHRLRRPIKEDEINDGRKRIDIRFDNANNKGFFEDLVRLHSIKCPYIFFECKNYTTDLKNPEFDQIIGRFSKVRGHVGFIICRHVTNKKLLLDRSRDALKDKEALVICLEDSDILSLLDFRAKNDEQGIDDFLSDKLRAIIN